MTLLSTLTSCLGEGVLSETSQQRLFHEIIHNPSGCHYRSLFESLINKRCQMAYSVTSRLQQANLRTLYKSKEYAQLVSEGGTATSSASKELNQALEKVAIKHFGSLSRMWAHIELEVLSKRQVGSSTLAPGITFNDADYSGQLIENVETSSLVVSSPHREGLYSLGDALRIANIDLFVLEQSWYELLPLIDLSATGCHFILLHCPNGHSHPCLASSAMITSGLKRKEWLSHTHFFQHSGWQCQFNEQSVRALNHTDSFDQLTSTADTLEEFDANCIAHLNSHSTICEILRLTVAGQKVQRLYLLYLAQKKMAQCLNDAGYQCAYTIIENPWLLNFYDQLSGHAYVNLASYIIEGEASPTFRGMWLVEAFNFQYSSIDFRQYKQMVRSKVRSKEVNDA